MCQVLFQALGTQQLWGEKRALPYIVGAVSIENVNYLVWQNEKDDEGILSRGWRKESAEWWGWGPGTEILNVVRRGLTKRVTLDIETKGVSHEDIQWRSLEMERPASAIYV